MSKTAPDFRHCISGPGGGCRYLTTMLNETYACYFCGVEGHRRGCPIDRHCTRYASVVETKVSIRHHFDPEAARRLWEAKKTDKQIAKEIGCSFLTVAVWRRNHGLAPNRLHDYRPLYEQGLTDGEIAAAVGVRIEAVSGWRQYHKLPPNRSKEE